jgi:hypothetical protein
MSKFLTGEELQKTVYDIIWDAEETLLIVSPYIKLDEYFKRLFDKHINNPKIHLVIVFGKNEGSVAKSLGRADFNYFKMFLKVSIVYVPALHAKYYGNENKGVVTSINLYDYSFKNNIEFGIFSEVKFLNALTTSSNQHAWQTCFEIANQNEAVFIKRPMYERKLLSPILGKNFVKSDVLLDTTQKLYGLCRRDGNIKRITDFPDELELGTINGTRPDREEFEKPASGFCIRTGVKIPFNLKKPFSESAYKIWVQHKNFNYPEKFCHRTGKESKGRTSMKDPILN